MSLLTGAEPGALLGNHPGYVLTLHRLLPDGSVGPASGPVLNSDRYEARVKVTRTGDLAGNQVTVTLEGLTDADHRAVAAKHHDGRLVLPVVRVHLFWRDTNSTVGAYLSNLAGIGSLTAGLGTEALANLEVGEYQLTQVTRRRGERRYETELTGVDRIAFRLRRRLAKPHSFIGLADAATSLAAIARVPCFPWPIRPTDPEQDPAAMPFTTKRGERVADALQRLSKRIELLTNRYGRGMLLIRDGLLVVGPRRIPFSGSPRPLTWTTGLLAVEAEADLQADVEATASPGAGTDAGPAGDAVAAGVAGAVAGAVAGVAGAVAAAAAAGAAGEVEEGGEPDDDEPGMSPPRRSQWRMTLRGRPDLQPGDVVAFDPPSENAPTQPGVKAAVLGAFAAPFTGVTGAKPRTEGYVSSVTHELARGSGLLTVLTVVEFGAGDDGWDYRTAPVSAPQAQASGDRVAAASDAAVRFAALVDQAVDRQLRQLDLPEVGEVREYRSRAGGPRAAAHRARLWQGTSPADDGAGHTATRLPIETAAPLEQTEVPYVTPFAWGKAGLVLPRYPGTRVASVSRHGRHGDTVDIGALWPDGSGPDAEPGDWWLSLPAAVDPAQRSSVAENVAPKPYAGVVSNDLTDAGGHRAVEVQTLRIQIGRDGLQNAGQRPALAAGGVVLSIEHTDGTTTIQISDSGDVKITAAGRLDLSGNGVSIDAQGKDVTIKADTVAVEVSSEMTVD